jgi:hypothetical protein
MAPSKQFLAITGVSIVIQSLFFINNVCQTEGWWDWLNPLSDIGYAYTHRYNDPDGLPPPKGMIYNTPLNEEQHLLMWERINNPIDPNSTNEPTQLPIPESNTIVIDNNTDSLVKNLIDKFKDHVADCKKDTRVFAKTTLDFVIENIPPDSRDSYQKSLETFFDSVNRHDNLSSRYLCSAIHTIKSNPSLLDSSDVITKFWDHIELLKTTYPAIDPKTVCQTTLTKYIELPVTPNTRLEFVKKYMLDNTTFDYQQYLAMHFSDVKSTKEVHQAARELSATLAILQQNPNISESAFMPLFETYLNSLYASFPLPSSNDLISTTDVYDALKKQYEGKLKPIPIDTTHSKISFTIPNSSNLLEKPFHDFWLTMIYEQNSDQQIIKGLKIIESAFPNLDQRLVAKLIPEFLNHSTSGEEHDRVAAQFVSSLATQVKINEFHITSVERKIALYKDLHANMLALALKLQNQNPSQI